MKYFDKFFICPNCKNPLYRKSSMKRGMINADGYCGKCGADIANAKKKALAKLKCQKSQ